MKGLIIKDIRHIRNMKTAWFVVICMIFLMTYAGGVFPGIYLAIMSVSMVQSTFSYDQHEDGMSYLLTLPVTRKEYVRGKYILPFVIGVPFLLLAGFISAVLRPALGLGDAEEALLGVAVGIPAMVIYMALYFPTVIKFGFERGRIAILIVTAVVTGASAATMIVMMSSSGAGSMAELFGSIPYAMALLPLILIILLYISYRISIRVIMNKEY